MASLLRQIVAGPRARHPEAGLDLCYVTDRIIATSGPSGTYPKRYYRNPLDQLIAFLDKKHGENWAIWEFRAEGTGYPDEAVYGRILHFPFPDHHPPPFALVPDCLASMRDWLGADKDRVVVVHCKAGKGRSGTASCSYLIAEEGWKMEDAIKRFTERRMKPGWGAGVSIPSQLRWLRYVTRWTDNGKKYVERKVEVCEIHVWGLRDGVSIAIRGFIEEGKIIKVSHTFTNEERMMVNGEVKSLGFAEAVMEMMGKEENSTNNSNGKPKAGNEAASIQNSAKVLSKESLTQSPAPVERTKMEEGSSSETVSDETSTAGSNAKPSNSSASSSDKGTPERSNSKTGADAIFRPAKPIFLDTNDINLDVERRTRGAYTWTVTTSVAHVWFNTFFEGNGPENGGIADESGVFEIEWNKMDGIKGSSRKGTRAFDKVSIVWKAVEVKGIVEEPKVGEATKQKKPADWRQTHDTVMDNSTDDLSKKRDKGAESSDEELGIKPHTTRE